MRSIRFPFDGEMTVRFSFQVTPKGILRLGGVLLLGTLLTACARINPAEAGNQAGFLMGLFHGFIQPFALIIKLLGGRIGIYEVYNSGGWYDSGYVLGCLLIYGSSAGTASSGGKPAE